MKRIILLFTLLLNLTLLSAQTETVKYKYVYSCPVDEDYQINKENVFTASNHVGKQLEISVNLPYKTAFIKNDNIQYDMMPINGCFWFSYLMNDKSWTVRPDYEEYFLDENLLWVGGLISDANNKLVVHIFQKL